MQQGEPAARDAAILGWIDRPVSEGIVGPIVRIEGWALARAGVAAVEVRVDGHRIGARGGLPRADVAAAHADYQDAGHSGFEFTADLSAWPAPRGVDRRTLAIVAIDAAGRESVLGTRSLIERSAHERWRFLRADSGPAFHVLPALSGVGRGGAFGLDTWYAAYTSPTMRVGMRVPILYLRTTHGAPGDYAFDAHFDPRRSNGARAVADDALAPVLAHAVAHRLPVLVTLNGGIWSDAPGTCPEWDLTDRLEEDPANCQWNERAEVMPDGYLTRLPGSHEAPELSRALTLNVHARAVRAYKRRNLQQAAAHLVAFMREHDELFVGVNLDPDVYVNPFFAEAQWYDYNPGTLRQFREWLAGSGPYAGETRDGAPDLRSYRRPRTLTLDDAGAIARCRFRSWQDVDPPRAFPRNAPEPFWSDPWVREWEHFRRHLVALHYDELARWLAEAGIPRDRIWSSQGLMAPVDEAMPLALSIDSPVKNYDSGGVSIEGSKPRDGHLGAIVYGDAATNAMPMENGKAFYATLARVDPDFGVVEFNTADLRHPERHPTYAHAYRGLRDLWNAGARFVSPMAWNGANGLFADDPGYVAYTAWRNTPLEDATRDFMLARSGLPRGAKLWTFGSASHAADDGWTVDTGGMRALRGALELVADARGTIVVDSPPDLDVRCVHRVVLGIEETIDGSIEVATKREDDARWKRVGHARLATATRTAAGIVVDCRGDEAARLRLAFAGAPYARLALARVAVLQD
jgi:hypothetical protein